MNLKLKATCWIHFFSLSFIFHYAAAQTTVGSGQTLSFNTGATPPIYSISGGGSGTGSIVNGEATFNFSGLSVSNGAAVSVSGNVPLSIVSTTNIFINAVINISAPIFSAISQIGGGGGAAGGYAGGSGGINITAGSGPGGGRYVSGKYTGGGGGYGGNGGGGRGTPNDYGVTNGLAQLLVLQGGSGGSGGRGDWSSSSGASASNGGAGGGGGGAIGFTATSGNITIGSSGQILANGGGYDNTTNGVIYQLAGAGGSGGAIRLAAGNGVVTINGTLSAAGGQGGSITLVNKSSNPGAGGGGGRIAIYSASGAYSGSGTVSVAAGAGGKDGSGNPCSNSPQPAAGILYQQAGSLPGVASVPSPANNATTVPVLTPLSWIPGSGTTNQAVYFSTNSMPTNAVASGNGSLNSLANNLLGGPLLALTTYYWTVQNNGQNGVVWNFTTGIGKASSPIPANGLSVVNTNIAALTWTPDGGEASFNVYFGTNSGAVAARTVAAVNVAAPSFTVPGPLRSGVTYYWAVDGLGAGGSILTGDLWSFTAQGGQLILTVAADGSGNYTNVQAAVNSIPNPNNSPVQILIKPGTYYGHLGMAAGRNNITIVGQGAGPTNTLITWLVSSVGGNMDNSTVSIYSTNISFENLTLQNTEPVNSGQANALTVSGGAGWVEFKNVYILSTQDTLFLCGDQCHGGPLYFTNCTIAGTVDYICGDSTAWFDGCNLSFVDRGAGQGGFLTANNCRATTAYGFVFNKCTITGPSDSQGNWYLGRAWYQDASVTYLYCKMDGSINPAGWYPWNGGTSIDALARYSEYGTMNLDGSAYDLSRRNNSSNGWTNTRDPMSLAQASVITLSNVLGSWVPPYTLPANTNSNAQTPAVQTPPTAGAISYGQTLASSALSGGAMTNAAGGMVGGGFAFTTPGIAPNAGTTNVSVTFTPTNTTDYNSTTLMVNVTVGKATPTVSVTVGTYNYNGSPQGPNSVTTSPVSTGAVTFSYLGVGGTAYGPSSTRPTAGGNYTATATVAADSNCNSGASNPTAFAISASGGAILTVAADGSGNYTTVQAAVSSLPHPNTNHVEIDIKPGGYNEHVSINAANVDFVGLGATPTNTVIWYSISSASASPEASTVSIYTTNITFQNLTIQNTLAINSGQANAVNGQEPQGGGQCGAGWIQFKNCYILSTQDTMYLAGHSACPDGCGPWYFINCTIAGTVDYICGDALAWFEGCNLVCVDHGANSGGYIATANNRPTDPYGFVLNNCTITGPADSQHHWYLGRNWYANASTYFLNCKMDNSIASIGWVSNMGNGTASARYGEYNAMDINGAPYTSAQYALRASPTNGGWTLAEEPMTDARAAAFTLTNVMAEYNWNPSFALCVGAGVASGSNNQSVPAGSAATFSVIPTTGSSPTYQWQVSNDGGTTWNNVTTGSGGTTSSYTTPGTVLSDSGKEYRCILNVACGGGSMAISAAATLTVQCTPAGIAANPTNQTVQAGVAATLWVTATGSSPTYQWQVSPDGGSTWNNVSTGSGGTTGSYTTPATTTGDNGKQYRCVASVACNNSTATSTAAMLTVNCTSAGISTNPVSQSIQAGSTAAFTAAATGSSPTYQWQVSPDGGSTWNNVSTGSGGATDSYTTPATTTGDNGKQYRCVASVACNSSTATSTAAILTVNCTSAGISTNPANQSVQAGSTAMFTTAATGSNPTYQWQVSTDGGTTWNNVSTGLGGTTSSYTTPVTVVGNSGNKYRCLAMVACDNSTATSTAATLTVLPPVGIQRNNANQSLSNGADWVGGVVPGSSVIAEWDSTRTSADANGLGGNLNWAGITILNPGGAVDLGTGSTLTLGSSGIDMSAATVNLSYEGTLALGADQTWNLASGRTLTFSGGGCQIGGAYNLTLAGAGTVIFTSFSGGSPGAPTYTGKTIINGGTLQLASGMTLPSTPQISIGSGATFDVSSSSTYTWPSANTLNASGTGTMVGTNAAVIKGGATVSLGSQPINLTFAPGGFAGDSTHPALLMSQGALTLNNNIISVNNASGTPLGAGTYRLVQVNSGTISGTPNATPTITGSGLAAGCTASNSVSGGNVNLVVTSSFSGPGIFTQVPGITSSTISGGNIVIHGTNGQLNDAYYLLAGTNLSLPLSQWKTVATNVFPANGSFTFTGTNVVFAGESQRFFILSNTNANH